MKQILFILMFLSGIASAQKTATSLFNPAAKEYINGENAAASNLVSQALAQFPTDEKLQKLKKLIEEQKEQQDQQQQQQNQDQQNQDNQDQQNQDQENQDQQNQDQQEPEEQEEDQQDEEQADQEEPSEEDEQESQPTPAQQAGQMSEEEAKQLLDSMKLNEKDQRSDKRPFLGAPVRVDKDW